MLCAGAELLNGLCARISERRRRLHDGRNDMNKGRHCLHKGVSRMHAIPRELYPPPSIYPRAAVPQSPVSSRTAPPTLSEESGMLMTAKARDMNMCTMRFGK